LAIGQGDWSGAEEMEEGGLFPKVNRVSFFGMEKHHQAQLLSMARADHEILARAIKNFRRLFAGNHPSTAAQEFNEIKQLITQKIPEHFADEEAVFPSLLSDNPSQHVAQVIAELRSEHIQLLEEVQQVSDQLHPCTLTQCHGHLWLAMLDVFKALEKHAAKEEQLFKSFR